MTDSENQVYPNFESHTNDGDAITHQDERYVSVVLLIEVLDLLDCQVEKGEVVSHDDRRFGSFATHGSAQASVKLNHHKLSEDKIKIRNRQR